MKVKVHFIAAVAVLFALLALVWPRGGTSPAGPAHRRPGTSYRPSAQPLRHAARPNLPLRHPRVRTEAEDPRDEVEGREEDGEAIADDDPIPEDDPDLVAMAPSRHFSSLVWTALEEADDVILDKGALLLDAPDPEHRALGGVMLFFAKGLAEEFVSAIVEDVDPMVPLAVYDWIRDFGSDEEVKAFSDALADRQFSDEELFSFAAESRSWAGGGRSALDLWLARLSGQPVPAESLARLVASGQASLDVREQALFKLLEPETKARGLAALEAMSADDGNPHGPLMEQTLDKLMMLSEISNADGDETKIWDAEAPVVFFLAESEGGLPARDLANYLEYALRRDDPEVQPIVEEGTWEFANDFLQRMQPLADTLRPEELDALDRIALSLDRLVDYDPAFNPFEEVEEGEDPEQEFFEEEDGDDTSAQ